VTGPAGPPAPRGLVAVVLAPLRGVVAIVVILDELARPLYRPVVAWFAALGIVRRAETAIALLPPYAVLTVLAIPLVAVEPLKILGLVWMGQGRLVAGVVMLGFAYGASFLVVERIYHAGHGQLMRIRWVAFVMGRVTRIRRAVIAWARATRVFATAMRLVQQARAWRLAVIRALRSGRART
jgi:hypothetical protein